MVLTVKQVATRLNCCEHLVYAYIYEGRLIAVNICRRPGVTRAAWRIPEKALERFLTEHQPWR